MNSLKAWMLALNEFIIVHRWILISRYRIFLCEIFHVVNKNGSLSKEGVFLLAGEFLGFAVIGELNMILLS